MAAERGGEAPPRRVAAEGTTAKRDRGSKRSREEDELVRSVLPEAGGDSLANLQAKGLVEEVLSRLRGLEALAAEVEGAAARATGDTSGLAVRHAGTWSERVGAGPAPERSRYRPPSRVFRHGPAALGAATRWAPFLDLAVEMPAYQLDTKSYLDHGYHTARVQYLAAIADALADGSRVGGLAWTTLDDDPRRPALLVYPPSPAGAGPVRVSDGVLRASDGARVNSTRSGTSGETTYARPSEPLPAVRVSAVPPAAYFKLSRFGLAQNNLRTHVGEDGALLPTPHYNQSVLKDILLASHQEDLEAAATRAGEAAFSHALVLLAAWARGAGLAEGAGGLSDPLLAAVLAGLVARGAAPPTPSPLELARAALVQLAGKRPLGPGATLPARRDEALIIGAEHPPSRAALRKAFPVVLQDSSRWLNLSAGVATGLTDAARAAASRALSALGEGSPEGFQRAFPASVPLSSSADAWIRVCLPDVADTSAGGNPAAVAPNVSTLAHDLPVRRTEEARVASVATRALGDRARWVRVVGSAVRQIEDALGAPPSISYASPNVLVAARLAPGRAARLVDIGPAADSGAPAAAFRDFWGPKSGLRRFQDGSICEAVVWRSAPDEAAALPETILAYALARHVPGAEASGGAAELLGVLGARRAPALSPGSGPPGAVPDAGAAVAGLQAAADRLARRVREAGTGVLQITTVQQADSLLRGTAPSVPRAEALAGGPPPTPGTTAARVLEPSTLLVRVESTARWPTAPAAYAATKAALGCALASALSTQYGLDARASRKDVAVLADGYAFRLVLCAERDGQVARASRGLAPDTPLPGPLDADAQAAHHGAIAAAIATRPHLRAAVRLARRWLHAHLLAPHFPPEAAELLALAAIGEGSDDAASAPASPQVGLLAFLGLLAALPARGGVATADPAGEMAAATRARAERDARTLLSEGAARLGAPALALVTPRDPRGLAWTGEAGPTRAALSRAAALARRSAAALNAFLLVGARGGAPLRAVFSHPLSEYDAILELKRGAVPHAEAASDTAGLRDGETPDTIPLPQDAGAASMQDALDAEAPRLAGPGSRAVLSGVPAEVVAAHGETRLAKEALVDFDPVGVLLARLHERFGDAAVMCADTRGGRLVGIKWRRAVLAPEPPRTVSAAILTAPHDGAAALDSASVQLGALLDAAAIGAGLVSRVRVVRSV